MDHDRDDHDHTGGDGDSGIQKRSLTDGNPVFQYQKYDINGWGTLTDLKWAGIQEISQYLEAELLDGSKRSLNINIQNFDNV